MLKFSNLDTKKAQKNNIYPSIVIQNVHPSKKLPLSNKKLKAIINSIFRWEDFAIKDIFIYFLSDKHLMDVNRKFLKHRYLTDIITFDYSLESDKIEGEILISLDTVKKNSILFKNSITKEVARVIIHGCLHLVGYNDKNKKQMELMKQKENFYLKKLVNL